MGSEMCIRDRSLPVGTCLSSLLKAILSVTILVDIESFDFSAILRLREI